MTVAVEERTGSAADLHADDWPGAPTPLVRRCSVTAPALVLGSVQPADLVDRAAAAERGIEVVRRRSGGGAVLLEPGASIWIDVYLPRGDAGWDERPERTFTHVGQAWVAALTALGAPGPLFLHRRGLVADDVGRAVCFAGRGPGEVLVGGGAAAPKLVGLAQRRVRWGARVQGLLHRQVDLEAHRALLGVAPRTLAGRVTTADVDDVALAAALAAAL